MQFTIEQAKPLYQNDSAHDFDHVLRVLTNAERIGLAEQADMEILRTATLLHDIGRAEQAQTGEDHAIIGARRTRTMLTEAGCEPEFIEAVCHAIAAHRFRNNYAPSTLEAKILYDADKLDSIGAVGMARAFAFGGHVGRPLWLEDEAGVHTSLQEYRVKLRKIKDRLFTETARQMSQQRHDFMVEFVAQMNAELSGER